MNKTKISKFITKILLSAIFTLSSLIYINTNDNNREKYKKYVFQDSFDFNKVNHLLNKYINIDTNNKKNDELVFNETSNEIITFDKGTKFLYETENPISLLESGIIVYNGYKDDYGNTIIVQSINGYDMWYCNVSNSDIKIYDYLEKNTIIGSSKELILIIKKGDEYISYDEYLKKI